MKFIHYISAIAVLSLQTALCAGQSVTQTEKASGKEVSVAENAQSFTIINNSKYEVHFQIYASDKNGTGQKYTSLTSSVNALSKLKYPSMGDIKWIGNTPGKPSVFTVFNGMYMDASGACISNASNYVGVAKDFSKTEATINTTICGGTDLLHLTWNSTDGNILVVIN